MANTRSKQGQKEKLDSRTEIANSISIMDYANKHDIDILYEDRRIARIEDPDGNMLTVYKDSNSWSQPTGNGYSVLTFGDNNNVNVNQDGKTQYGNTIRFVAKMEEMEWRDALETLVENRGDYLSDKQYNEAYNARYEAENKEASKAATENTSSDRKNENMEIQKGRTVRIADYAREMGLPLKEVRGGKVTMIDDKKFEGILIYNNNNTWDWISRSVYNGDVIQFVEKIQNMNREKAMESLTAFADTGKIQEEEKAKEAPAQDTTEIPIEGTAMQEETPSDKKEELINSQETESPQPEVQKESGGNEAAQTVRQPKQILKTMSKEQLSEILSGYRRGIDISSFDNPDLKPEQMRQLRLAKQNGINPEEFNHPSLPAEYMKEMRLAKQMGLDLKIFKNENNQFIFTPGQAREIRLGHQNGLSLEDITSYAKQNNDEAVMKEVRLGLQDGMEQMKKLCFGNYSAKDIHAIRMTILVNQIVDTIKTKMRNLYDSIIALFKRGISYERVEQNILVNDGPTQERAEEVKQPEKVDIEKEALFEFKDAIETVYEAMSDELQDIPLEKKKEMLVNAFRSILQQAREMEQTVAVKNQDEINKAVDEFIEEKETESLKQSAYKSLQDEYVDQFFDNENHYNEQLIEFSNSVINNNFIALEQKVVIFNKTLGAVYGEGVAANWIKHLPEAQQSQAELNQEQLRMIREEYEQITTVTEVAEYEAG